MEYLSDYVRKALEIAINVHAGQKDKAGREYIHHPVTVAMILAKNGYSDAHIAAGLLHDVVEDGDYTFDDLRREGIPEEVVEALTLLTHDESVPYMDYVKAAKENPIARAVKRADLLHNMDESRIASPTEKDRECWAKYHQAFALLDSES